ncbi:hypothetical protein KP509_16G036700 [Ceratopteris richardii]|nr:hypothetical protein KP509_16G036700 [Ceratopteris richardii]
MSTISNSYMDQNVFVPMGLHQKKKRPFLSSREVYEKKKNRCNEALKSPGNGLLVPQFVPLAVEALQARATLLCGVQKLLNIYPVKACRFCLAVHVGPVGHHVANCIGPHNGTRHGRHDWVNGEIEDILPRMEVFHLYDRLEKPIVHEERFKFPRIPAIVELCIQAGVNVAGYPTKRRQRPVKLINNKLIEYDDLDEDDSGHACKLRISGTDEFEERNLLMDNSFEDIEASSYDKEILAALAEKTMQAWFLLRSRVEKLMSRYMVYVCGYCPQVHVGPKGTKTSDCRAYKHYLRSGHHGWQEASIDDLIPLKYVWHLQDYNGPPLSNELKVFYGAAPAIVELCAQAGAPIPEEYKAMMRLDVVVPTLSEFHMVV